MRGEVARGIRLYGEMHRFIPAVASWMGVSLAEVPVNHRPRTRGRSKYGLGRTVRVLLDLFTVRFLHSYGTRPAHLFGLIGLAFGALRRRGPRLPRGPQALLRRGDRRPAAAAARGAPLPDRRHPRELRAHRGAARAHVVREPGQADLRDPGAAQAPLTRVLFLAESFHPVLGGGETHVRRLGSALVAAGDTATVVTRRGEASWPAEEVVDGIRVVRVPSSRTGTDGEVPDDPGGLPGGAPRGATPRRARRPRHAGAGPARARGRARVGPRRRDAAGDERRAERRSLDVGQGLGGRGRRDGSPGRRPPLRNRLAARRRRVRGHVAGHPGRDARGRGPRRAHRASPARGGHGAVPARRPRGAGGAAGPAGPAGRRPRRLRRAGCCAARGSRRSSRRSRGSRRRARTCASSSSGPGRARPSPSRTSLRRRVPGRGLAGRVVFTGRVERVEDTLRAADLFVFPSVFEALGIALVEAAACGLPAVASRTGGIVDVVEDGRSGRLVAPGDAGGPRRGARAPSPRTRPSAPRWAGRRAQIALARFDERDGLDRYRALFREVTPRRASSSRPGRAPRAGGGPPPSPAARA